MDARTAAYAAATLSFIFAVMAAKWYAAPLLRARSRETALVALLWIHALRYIALQLFSAQAAGFAVPDDVRDRIIVPRSGLLWLGCSPLSAFSISLAR
jgi:hypothetical protein